MNTNNISGIANKKRSLAETELITTININKISESSNNKRLKQNYYNTSLVNIEEDDDDEIPMFAFDCKK